MALECVRSKSTAKRVRDAAAGPREAQRRSTNALRQGLMRVFLTGGTGFVGRYVLGELLQCGHDVRCLVRKPPAEARPSVEYVPGDVTMPESLGGLLDDCEAVIHLVGIIEENSQRGITYDALHTEATRHVVRQAQRSAVKRFVLMSANGAKERGISRYQTTKWQAEELLRSANFAHWTILRPSLIFGDPGVDCLDFCSRLARDLVKRLPIIPIFGRGDYAMQPIFGRRGRIGVCPGAYT